MTNFPIGNEKISGRLLKIRDLGYQQGMSEKTKTDDGEAQSADLDKSMTTSAPSISESDRRKARAAAKLKENLLRRKQQVRARRAGEADETDGLPAAKMDKL